MKAYIITKGEYSDYHICAVTLDEDKAEPLKKLFTDEWHEAYVEEYEVDAHFPIDYPYFLVYKYSDGRIDIKETETCDYDYGVVRKCYNNKDGTFYVVSLKAKDEEHAKKIALDKIEKYKAEKLGL